MRPPERDVTIVLHTLECKKTEDADGDEPYLWVLGFKVDATSITSAVPLSLTVQVFEGGGSFRNLVGPRSVWAPETLPVPAALGVRTIRVKPWRTPLRGWFPGLVGVIVLLWDEDSLEPETVEAGFQAFRETFPTALAGQLQVLLNGRTDPNDPDYDLELTKDAQDTPHPELIPAGGATLPWRLGRLQIREARDHAVKAITGRIKDAIADRIKDVYGDAAWWELVNPDDLLGAEVQAFTLDELSSIPKAFTLDFTDEDTEYHLKGQATAAGVNVTELDAAVTRIDKSLDTMATVEAKVCFRPPAKFDLFAYRQWITTRYELRTLTKTPLQQIRWFLDGTPLAEPGGSISVQFRPMAEFESKPEDALAPQYPGGPGTLYHRQSGTVLEIWNDRADGVFSGTVTALYTYAGDQPLVEAPLGQWDMDSGYTLTANLWIEAIDLAMESEFYQRVDECEHMLRGLNLRFARSRAASLLDLGNPPPLLSMVRRLVRERAALAERIGLEVVSVLRGPALQAHSSPPAPDVALDLPPRV